MDQIRIKTVRSTASAMLGAALLACLALAPMASADVTASPYVNTSDAKLGAHGDWTTGATFDYGSSTSETVKRVIYDLPAGLTIDPAAVPFASRCTQAIFDAGVCDAASQVGSVTVAAVARVGIITGTIPDLPGTISLIQTTPAVPIKLGFLLADAGTGIQIRATAQIDSVDGGSGPDFLRAVSSDLPSQISASGQTATFQITKFEQKLLGKVGGVNFLTNPASGTSWNAFAYYRAWETNTNANSDPLAEGGGNHFVKFGPLTIAAEAATSPPVIPPASGSPAPPAPVVDYGVTVKDVKKCLKKPSLQVSPTIATASQVASMTILANKKQVKRLTGPKFSAKVSLPAKLKLKKGKSYKYEVQVQFKADAANPGGLLVKKSAKFTLCK